MPKYIISLDQGTTSSRCILFDQQGNICSAAQKEFTQIYPQPGWVEHDPMEIWSTQLSVTMEAMGKLGAHYSDIAAIGITNQRETTIVWDRETGKPVYNAIVWQCRRTADRIEDLRRDGMQEKIMERTGLIPDAYYSGSKLEWILNHVEGVRERAQRGELLFGTVDSWLIWNLTKGAVHVTDYTNASRTMLFDIHKMQWDQEILDHFGVPRSMLPQVRPSSCIYGYTSSDVMGGRIPIAGAGAVRTGRQRVCLRCSHPVAAGRDAHDPHVSADGGVLPALQGHRRRLHRTGLCGAGRTLLGAVCPRHHSRRYPWHQQGTVHPGYGGIDGLSGV